MTAKGRPCAVSTCADGAADAPITDEDGVVAQRPGARDRRAMPFRAAPLEQCQQPRPRLDPARQRRDAGERDGIERDGQDGAGQDQVAPVRRQQSERARRGRRE